jgi:hypothetical protein
MNAHTHSHSLQQQSIPPTFPFLPPTLPSPHMPPSSFSCPIHILTPPSHPSHTHSSFPCPIHILTLPSHPSHTHSSFPCPIHILPSSPHPPTRPCSFPCSLVSTFPHQPTLSSFHVLSTSFPPHPYPTLPILIPMFPSIQIP